MYHKELTWTQRGRLWLRLGIRLCLGALGVLLVWKLGGPLLSLLMPFLLALGAAVLLNPLVRWIQRRLGWSRQLVSLVVLLALFGLLGTGAALLGRAAVLEVVELAENWESLLAGLEQGVHELDVFLQGLLAGLPIQVTPPDQTLLEQMFVWVRDWFSGAAPDLGNLTAFARDKAAEVTSFALALVAFLMASYFISADYPYLRTRAVQHLDEGALALLRQVKAAAVAAFGGYLKAQVLLSVGVFFILLAGFLLGGQSYALLLALALAVLDFIPLLGSGTVMVPWAVIALFTGRYETAIYVMLTWGAVAVFRRVAEPKIVGDQTGLSPVLSLVSIYVGMRLGGVAGMILGPILTLMALNLLGLGLMDAVWADVRMAAEDVLAILAGREETEET